MRDLETAAILKVWAERKTAPVSGVRYTRKETALRLGITTEVLRNWERNGLVNIERSGKKNEKVYDNVTIMRLRIIYMLRQNHYSIAAIRKSLQLYDDGNSAGAALALNQFTNDPDRIYIASGDHWLEVLSGLSRQAEQMEKIVMDFKA